MQTAVSHSGTEAKIISVDAGPRLEGIPALNLLDKVPDVSVLPAGISPTHHNKPMKTKSLMAEKRLTDSIDFGVVAGS